MTNNNHSIYTAADIEKYLTGKLTSAEMHAMEKEALDDPFLAEAMEGYESMPVADWKDQLAAAQEELAGKTAFGKVVPLQPSRNKWWKAVAAIVVLGGGVALTYTLTNNKTTEQPTIAQTKRPPGTTNPVTAVPDTTIIHSSISKTDITIPTGTSTKGAVVISPANQHFIATSNDKDGLDDRAVTSNAAPLTSADSNFVYRPTNKPASGKISSGGLTNGDLAVNDKKYYNQNQTVLTNNAVGYNAEVSNSSFYKANTVPANNGTLTNTWSAPAERKIAAEFLAKAKDQNLNRSFLAQVVGPDNTPLPFANINIKQENFGTYADVKGNFRLVSTDSMVTVEVRSVGFEPKTFTLNSGALQNKIVLSEDRSTASGYTIIKDMGPGKASRRATLLKDSIVNVEPADGWDNYNTYVSNNIEIPDDILKKDLHGQMEISFTIQPNGAITDIQVDNSQCNNCDEAAARKLIEQGPQWKLKKGKKGRAHIKVQF